MEENVEKVAQPHTFVVSHPVHLVILGLVISVVAVLSSLGTYYFLLPRESTNQKDNSYPVQLPSPSMAQVQEGVMTQETMIDQEISGTDNWKVYTNTLYAYSFKYPAEWNTNTIDPMHIYLTKGYTLPNTKGWNMYEVTPTEKDTQKLAVMQISNIDDAGTISQGSLSEVAKKWRDGEQTELVIDGHEAIRVHELPLTGARGVSFLGNPHTISVFVRNASGKTFMMQLEAENDAFFEPIFDQLLTTFHFTK